MSNLDTNPILNFYTVSGLVEQTSQAMSHQVCEIVLCESTEAAADECLGIVSRRYGGIELIWKEGPEVEKIEPSKAMEGVGNSGAENG